MPPSTLPPTRRALLAGLAALPLAAALPGGARAAAPLQVVATTSMIADLARMIGGGRLAVAALMGPGVDPHAYRQTRTDIVKMARADLVLANGLYLEAQMEEFLDELSARRPVLAVAEASIPEGLRLGSEDYAGRWDPHVWMDPALWSRLVPTLQARLSELDPEGAADYAAGAEATAQTLLRLDAYAREVLASVPQERRALVSAHDAFRYFGRAYGFEVMGIQGISTESEAGLARIEELVGLLVARGIPAVFVESSVPERNVRALIEGAQARGHAASVGAELFSDAMGLPGTYEGTYPGMIDHNVTAVARALGGNAPARGMDGRLSAGL
ncbi:metal ABC transporter solute-binding protein, Zn/Mn family [Albimonas pacifica]|uniref:Manganese/zinc/iron transport system substrate-binding protein n=1 Tax=Albimonas pacifica TaxID=1114924 RepID=A0A1I3K9L2_9RHOB|nr:zinc ABC transporter substrate-binding protein [Albimonas pacifica]SFI69030.1 manganese/zinc/iron transport system substrate-binding protein [Albimonas pacifica]